RLVADAQDGEENHQLEIGQQGTSHIAGSHIITYCEVMQPIRRVREFNAGGGAPRAAPARGFQAAQARQRLRVDRSGRFSGSSVIASAWPTCSARPPVE